MKIMEPNFIKKILVEYEMYYSNCDRKEAEKKAHDFLEYKKTKILLNLTISFFIVFS